MFRIFEASQYRGTEGHDENNFVIARHIQRSISLHVVHGLYSTKINPFSTSSTHLTYDSVHTLSAAQRHPLHALGRYNS